MTRWESKSRNIFGEHPGKANNKNQQKNLNAVTLAVAIGLYAFLIYLTINVDLNEKWLIVAGTIAMSSLIDGIFRYHRYLKRRRKFYWQLFIARSSVYGFIALNIVMILQCV